MKQPSCGLYFGSFNPLHIGHVAIANYLAYFTDLDNVRLILSPQNPLKVPQTARQSVLELRLEHIRKVMEDKLLPVEVSDVEFHLPQPLYTINTLRHLQRTIPDTRFVPVFGADNLSQIERWYRWEEIFRDFEIYIYPRQGVDAAALCEKYNARRYPSADGSALVSPMGLRLLDAPLIGVSSTFVREGLASGKNMNGFLC